MLSSVGKKLKEFPIFQTEIDPTTTASEIRLSSKWVLCTQPFPLQDCIQPLPLQDFTVKLESFYLM